MKYLCVTRRLTIIGDFLGIVGLLGFVISLIWLIVSLFRKRALKTPVILLIMFLFMFSIGMAILPSDNDTVIENGVIEDIETDEAINGEPDQEPEQEENGEVAEIEEPEDPEEDVEIAEERAPPTGKLEVHFIDVGQGDSIFIKTPEKNILIDGGGRGNTVVNYLRNQGVESLDLVIGTHPHADHIGGLINVMQAIPVKEIIDPGVAHTTVTFEDYLDVIDEKDIIFTEGRAGMKRDLGSGAEMKIIHPTSPSSSHLNDASIVCRVTFGEVSFMFTGDAEQGAESQILNRGYELKSDILKVGHHGSRTSTTPPFLSAVSPSTAIIMCGAGNTYGHPHEETLNTLSDAGVDIYRTDKQGSIVITTDGSSYNVNEQPYAFEPQQGQTQEQDVDEADIEGKFVGSSQSDRYHFPDCRHAESINPENLISFGSVSEAKEAGYVPCGVCKPPQ